MNTKLKGQTELDNTRVLDLKILVTSSGSRTTNSTIRAVLEYSALVLPLFTYPSTLKFMSYAVLSGFPFFPVFRSRTFSRFYRFPGAPRLEIVGGRFLLVSRNRVRVSRPNILADLKTAVIINNRHERKHLRTIIQVIQYSIVLPLIIIVSIIVVN